MPSPRDIQKVLDDVVNALQPAVLLTSQLVASAKRTADDAAQLDQAIRRAKAALDRLQPPTP